MQPTKENDVSLIEIITELHKKIGSLETRVKCLEIGNEKRLEMIQWQEKEIIKMKSSNFGRRFWYHGKNGSFVVCAMYYNSEDPSRFTSNPCDNCEIVSERIKNFHNNHGQKVVFYVCKGHVV